MDLVADPARKHRQRFGPGQCGAFTPGEMRRLAPDRDEVDLVGGQSERFRLQDMILQAERAAVDLRGADLDQLDQLLVEAGLCRELAERQQCLVDVGRPP
jgi:hypothetical protein